MLTSLVKDWAATGVPQHRKLILIRFKTSKWTTPPLTEYAALFIRESSSRFNFRKRRASLFMLLLKSARSRLKIQMQSWEEQDKNVRSYVVSNWIWLNLRKLYIASKETSLSGKWYGLWLLKVFYPLSHHWPSRDSEIKLYCPVDLIRQIKN